MADTRQDGTLVAVIALVGILLLSGAWIHVANKKDNEIRYLRKQLSDAYWLVADRSIKAEQLRQQLSQHCEGRK